MGRFPHPGNLPALAAGALLLLLPAPLVANVAPVVDSLTADPVVVAPGGVVSLEVRAHDPDCPDVCTSGCGQTIRADITTWQATGGTFVAEDPGTTGSPYVATADWQAPMVEDTYTIEVYLADSGNFTCGNRMSTTAGIDVQVTTVTNEPPSIDELTASPGQLFPGDVANLHCAATDPEGEPVTYSWSADAGTVTVGLGGEASFSSDVPALATVTCHATDPLGAPASATIQVSVSDAFPERRIGADLATPQRLAVDSMGDLYVVDRAAGGLVVVHLESGERVYRLALPDLVSVAVDWNDDLLIGHRRGARVIDREGNELLALDPGEPLGMVADVAVDAINLRYAVLHRSTGRVVVYDAGGGLLGAFGSTGNGPDQVKSPQGLAITPGGNFVVADGGHGLIKVFDLGGNVVAAFGGLGSGAGEFVRLDDVEVDGDGIIYASDSFQDWVQSFHPAESPAVGTTRETLGTYGDELGRFKTPTGLAAPAAFGKLVVASVNGSDLQVYRLADSLPGDWPAPEAALSDDQLIFDPREVGSTSAPQSLTLANAGTAPLGLRRVDLPTGFTAGNDCGAFLDPGQACTVEVAFAPQVPGDLSGLMTLDVSTGTPLTVALAGSAFVSAGIHLSPTELEFATQAAGTVSPPQTVRLTNPGTLPLLISGIVPSADFAQGNDCGGGVSGGTRCAIDVYFAPQTADDLITGTVTIASNAAYGPGAVSLLGRSILVELAVEPGSIYFPQSGSQTVMVINVGSEPVEIGAVTLAGDDAGEFLVRDDLCSMTLLTAGSACTLEVVYDAAAVGWYEATLVIANDTGRGPLTVALSAGTAAIFSDGFESGDMTAWSRMVSPTVLAFGDRPAGASAEATVTVTNFGSGTLELLPLEVAGARTEAFFIAADECSGARLEPRATCRLTVVFHPLTAGRAAARITIRAAGGGSPYPNAVLLRGNATP